MDSQKIKAFSVNKLSGELVKILGAKFDIDYETWTSRVHPSDRVLCHSAESTRYGLHVCVVSEVLKKSFRPGPKNFSHFYQSCPDFFRTSPNTLPEYSSNRKVSRTVPLMKFLQLKGELCTPSN